MEPDTRGDTPMTESREPKRERFQMVVPPDVLAEVRLAAAQENRSISNMLVVLVREALRVRRCARKSENEPGQRVPVAA
jgi:hypothetical protein